MELFTNEGEILRCCSKYTSEEFQMRCVSLKIPDVYQYISNIMLCMWDAEQCRQIIDDIRKQISDARKKTGQIINSTAYCVGSLNFDSRQFAQRSIREWCGNIAKINDSICQIINIILDLGYKPWNEALTKKVTGFVKKPPVKEPAVKKLAQLCAEFHSEIQIIQDINNFSKHNQNIFGIEKFSPLVREKVEYHLRYRGKEYKVSEMITKEKEMQIMKRVVDILDFLFAGIEKAKHKDRYYAFVDTVELPCYEPIDAGYYTKKPEDLDKYMLPITQSIQKNYDGTFTVSDVTLEIDSVPFPRLELAECYRQATQCFDMYSIGCCRCNLISVYRDGKKIGEYRCEDLHDQEEVYLHFKTYVFHEISQS